MDVPRVPREADGTEFAQSKVYIIAGHGDVLIDYDERSMAFPTGPTFADIKKALGVSSE